jgi:hypothetical protein
MNSRRRHGRRSTDGYGDVRLPWALVVLSVLQTCMLLALLQRGT